MLFFFFKPNLHLIQCLFVFFIVIFVSHHALLPPGCVDVVVLADPPPTLFPPPPTPISWIIFALFWRPGRSYTFQTIARKKFDVCSASVEKCFLKKIN